MKRIPDIILEPPVIENNTYLEPYIPSSHSPRTGFNSYLGVQSFDTTLKIGQPVRVQNKITKVSFGGYVAGYLKTDRQYYIRMDNSRTDIRVWASQNPNSSCDYLITAILPS